MSWTLVNITFRSWKLVQRTLHQRVKFLFFVCDSCFALKPHFSRAHLRILLLLWKFAFQNWLPKKLSTPWYRRCYKLEDMWILLLPPCLLYTVSISCTHCLCINSGSPLCFHHCFHTLPIYCPHTLLCCLSKLPPPQLLSHLPITSFNTLLLLPPFLPPSIPSTPHLTWFLIFIFFFIIISVMNHIVVIVTVAVFVVVVLDAVVDHHFPERKETNIILVLVS